MRANREREMKANVVDQSWESLSISRTRRQLSQQCESGEGGKAASPRLVFFFSFVRYGSRDPTQALRSVQPVKFALPLISSWVIGRFTSVPYCVPR